MSTNPAATAPTVPSPPATATHAGLFRASALTAGGNIFVGLRFANHAVLVGFRALVRQDGMDNSGSQLPATGLINANSWGDCEV
ncbi:MAG: hypothetical protein R3F37_17505 [Candidatus Competibacteraceae bacterium]